MTDGYFQPWVGIMITTNDVADIFAILIIALETNENTN